MSSTPTTPVARPGAAALPANLREALTRSELPALDGLRAVAVFIVAFYHCGVSFVPGGVGVLIFFVLSGFLITHLLLKEEDRYGQISLRHFYLRRSLRIFPAFYTYWLVLIGWQVLTSKHTQWPQAWSALFYVSNYYQALWGDPETGLSHAWSLGIEEQFYLLWPTLFLLLGKNRQTLIRRLSVLVLAIWAYRLILQFAVHVNQGYIYESFDTRADHLLIGCLLAIVLRTGSWSRCWRPLCSSPWAALPPAFLFLLSALAERAWGTGYRNSVSFILNPVLVALLIAQLMAFQRSVLWAWLNWPWMRYLGRISYSIYLYHQLPIGAVRKLLAAWPAPVQLVVTLAVIVAVASGSFFLIERPFLRLKQRFGTR